MNFFREEEVMDLQELIENMNEKEEEQIQEEVITEVDIHKTDEVNEVHEVQEVQEIQENIENVNYGLEEKGYLFLKGVYNRDLVDRINFEVQNFMSLEGIYSHLQKRQDVPQQRYFVNNTYGALQNFQQLQHYYVPVIDNRGTYNRVTDVGVIDIYNVNKLFPQIQQYFDMKVMLAILLKTTGIEWKLTRVNLQIYNNVVNSNQFHVDCGNEKNIKFTIFLSDIEEEMSGSLAFIEGSHINKKNIKLSQTKTFTGKKGDVLISYQNGYHRKMPNKLGGTNMFLTFHFTTRLERERYFPL